MNKNKKSTWKEQHLEFQKNLEYNKKLSAIEAKGGNIKDLPPPPRSEYSNLIPCKYCDRKFAPERIERHEVGCKNTVNKPRSIKSVKNNSVKPQSTKFKNK